MARILVIEDNYEFRQLLCLYLGEAGHSCEKIERGDLALETAKEAVEKGGPFGLVIIDGHYLPGKLGTEVCKELRADPAFADVPVLMISVLRPEVLRESLKGITVEQFMRKPLQFEDVVKAVAALVASEKGGPS